ncbi:MAG: hypothetical protein J5972_04305 [Eubacterium sp.]|nr:hypothetical protein [Eubacterium sp.]
MQTVITWGIVMLILCISIAVLCYVAHRGGDNDECGENKMQGCDGNCSSCEQKRRG